MKPTLLTMLYWLTCWYAGVGARDQYAGKNRDAAEPIKLETTIRGDQQQPTVLSIVAWQPPTAKSPFIDPTLKSDIQKLQPLNRRQFMREVNFNAKLRGKGM
ncbi:hypothetical protein ACFQMB_07020 [Pseudobowmanella zhangzhouensis]|uniref:hypothetical protein n=1 Tax=Pseudobowmanella zhangzhouensis TaxID=1537679 RepID=UPI003609E0F0